MAALRVGMTAALSGRYQPQGQQALLGVQAWVEETNRAGGMLLQGHRRPVELVVYDDASDATLCGVYTERLLSAERIDVLLGPYSSGLTLRAAEVAARHQHVLWNHGGALEPASAWTVGLLTRPVFTSTALLITCATRRPPASALPLSTPPPGPFHVQ